MRRPSPDGERFGCHCKAQPLRCLQRRLSIGLGQEERELLPTPPAGGIHGPQLIADTGCECLQDRIPRLMAQTVVDLLEVIDIQEQKRARAVEAPGMRQIAIKGGEQRAVVWQVRERIMHRLVLKPVF